MKFKKSSQLMLVSAASLLAAGLISACGTLTTDFVFVTSAKAAGTNNYGEIDIFEINSESGAMRQIPSSPVPSGGRNPVAEAVSTDNTTLFVLNKDDNTLVQFTIGSDGKLYPYNTMNTPGIAPVAVVANSSFLFIANGFQPIASCNVAAPCSGAVAVLPITAGTSAAPLSLGSAVGNSSNGTNYWPLNLTTSGSTGDVITPTAVVLSGSNLFVAAYDASVTPTKGYIFAYTVGSTGALTAVSGSPFKAGVLPNSLTLDGTGKYLYAADQTGNQVWGYTNASGVLAALSGSPYAAGNGPAAIVADTAYNYVYVANSTDSNVSAYSISNGSAVCNKATLGAGALCRLDNLSTGTSGTGTYASGLQPVAIGIDPSTNHFLFTVNFLGSTVNDWQLSSTDGTLVVAQGSPFSSNSNPTAVAAVPHK